MFQKSAEIVMSSIAHFCGRARTLWIRGEVERKDEAIAIGKSSNFMNNIRIPEQVSRRMLRSLEKESIRPTSKRMTGYTNRCGKLLSRLHVGASPSHLYGGMEGI